MSPKNFLFRFIGIFLIVTPLVLSGCSYIPWIGNKDDDDLAFEQDFPFEDERPAASQGKGSSKEDDFFAEEGALIEGAKDADFASIDQGTDSKELKGDVQSLQSQQEALISKVRELEEILRTLEPKVSATQERLEGSLASVTSQSEFLEPEVQDLKAKVIQLHEEIAMLKMQKGAGMAPRAGIKASKGGSQGTPPEYDKALAAYRNGNYDESILLFQNFALSNPPANLKDNILFWIGSNYIKLEMYDDAIKQFNTVISQFPNGNKTHDSRLMLGVSYYKKGETSKAIEILQSALNYNPPSDVKGKILAQLGQLQ